MNYIKRRLKRLMNQTVTIQNRIVSSSADPNEITYSSGSDNPCFKVSRSNTLLNKDYVDVNIDLLLVVYPDVSVKEQDRVIFDSLNYEVIDVDKLTRGRTGEDHHQVLICTRDKKDG